MPRNATGSFGQRLELYAATPAVGAQSLTGAWLPGYYSNSFAVFVLDVPTQATDVGDTLDVYIDTAVGGGATPVAVNVIHFTQILGNAAAAKREAVIVSPSASVAVAPVNVAADAASGAVRNIIGDQWRYRIVQVDANSNAAFPITLRTDFF